MDPTNSRTLFAGMWQIDIKTWGRKSGGPGSGVWVTHDGGAKWKRLTEDDGLPESPLGKIAVAVAPSDHDRVYALIETGDKGSLWRSDNGGKKWKLVSHSRLLNERPHYYSRMLVMPDNENEVYFPSNSMGATYDGGETTDQVRLGGRQPRHVGRPDESEPHDDRQRRRRRDLDDARKEVELRCGCRSRQMYHVATDTRIPYNVYGQMQDGGSMRGPSRNPGGDTILPALWTTTAGCETGWNTPDPVDPNIVWGGCYAGVVERYDARTRMSRSVVRLAGAHDGRERRRGQVPNELDVSDRDLAARSQTGSTSGASTFTKRPTAASTGRRSAPT